MIFLKTPMDRPRPPVRDAAPNRATPRRLRLVASWRQDTTGRLSCRWRAMSEPARGPG